MGHILGIVVGAAWLLCGLIPVHEYYWRKYRTVPGLGMGALSILTGPIAGLYYLGRLLLKV